MSDLPAGFVEGAAPSTPTNATDSGIPAGFVAGTPSAPSGGWRDVAANARTALVGGAADVLGFPHAIARLGDVLGAAMPNDVSFSDPLFPPVTLSAGTPTDSGKTPVDSMEGWGDARGNAGLSGILNTPPGFLTRHTLSSDEAAKGIWDAGNWWRRQVTGQDPVGPYEPQSEWGRLGQEGLRMATGAALSGGLGGIIPRTIGGLTGGLYGEFLRSQYPDKWWAKPLGNLVGFPAGAVGADLVQQGVQLGRSLLSAPYARSLQEPRVAADLATTANMPGSQLAQTIATNLPQWTPGTLPTLGDVTENTGLRARVYQDQTAAQRAATVPGGPPSPYPTNLQTTYQMQREAVAGATPSDAASRLAQLRADRDAALNAIPEGTTAQDAGEAFRSYLQEVQTQRQAGRAAGGSMFDALQTSPGQANLRPVMDYATQQAASNAGIVGEAYNAALNQFRSGTGITLDTPAFSNSVLKGLGDLAASYPRGSAAARAVNDVRGRLEASLAQDLPDVAAARQAWAANSRPLDVFEQNPFGSILNQDRFGRAYTMPSDRVASIMLRGDGSADALDQLNGIFGHPEAATRGLQDYIASEVKANALNPDGSINLGRMQSVLAPYQRALMRFPNLQRQFSTAEGAQTALNQQSAYQRLYDTVSEGLGTGQGAAFSNAKYQKWLQDNSALIDQAYTPEQAAIIRRVGTELSSMAQIAKVPGTSGTAQLMAAGEGGQGSIMKTIFGIIGAKGLGIPPEIGAMVANAAGAVRGQAGGAYNAVMRNALTDPAYARSLLLRYDPSGLNSSATEQAMRYVASRTPWVPLAGTMAAQTSPP